MSPSSTWSGEFTEGCKVKSRTGRDGDGDPTYGSQSNFYARIERGRRRKTETGGEGATVEHVDVLFTDQSISKGDIIWLPDDDETSDGEGRLVREVTHVKDLAGGDDLYEVVLT